MKLTKRLKENIIKGAISVTLIGSIVGMQIHSDRRMELFNQMKYSVDKDSNNISTREEWERAYNSIGRKYDHNAWLTSDLSMDEMRNYISKNQ